MIAMASFRILSPNMIMKSILLALSDLNMLMTATGSVADISDPNAMHSIKGIF